MLPYPQANYSPCDEPKYLAHPAWHDDQNAHSPDKGERHDFAELHFTTTSKGYALERAATRQRCGSQLYVGSEMFKILRRPVDLSKRDVYSQGTQRSQQ